MAWAEFLVFQDNFYVYLGAVLTSLLLTLGVTRWRRMTLLKRCRIPGPQPNFLTGNMKECFAMPNVLYDSELVKK